MYFLSVYLDIDILYYNRAGNLLYYVWLHEAIPIAVVDD